MKNVIFLLGIAFSIGANSTTVDNVVIKRIHMYELPAPNGVCTLI